MFAKYPFHYRPAETNEVEYCAFFNDTKHAEFDFLSNLHMINVVGLEGTFKCSEGLYQYQKFQYLNDPTILKRFMNANGLEAWNLSRSPEFKDKVDPNWNRDKAMRFALHAKFQDPNLRKQLLATGTKYLVENSPNGHDKYWSDNGDGTGRNKLGTFLMELRAELGGAGVVPRPAIL